MTAPSTVEATSSALSPTPPSSDSRSWKRAFADIKDGAKQRELWQHLGWQDIKQRYRRSVLGPFWITISQGVIALGLGVLYSLLMGGHLETFLPYVATGLIIWTFISGCLTEGMETFIANEGLIKILPAPLSVYTLRTVWRQTLMFGHNFLVYLVILVVFIGSLSSEYAMQSSDGLCHPEQAGVTCHPGIGWNILLAIPGFLLLMVNAVWVTILLGIISTRFRDIPQVINALMNLLFYLTPIVWPLDQVTAADGPRHELADVVLPFIKSNPFYHLEQVVRGPLLGQVVSVWSWVAVLAMTVVGWTLALFALRNYRARVSYWV